MVAAVEHVVDLEEDVAVVIEEDEEADSHEVVVEVSETSPRSSILMNWAGILATNFCRKAHSENKGS